MSDKAYPVAEDVARHALIDKAKYDEWYARSIKDPEGFWGEHGKRIDWTKPYSKVMDCSFDASDVHIRWFEDGTTNVSTNCIDLHLAGQLDVQTVAMAKWWTTERAMKVLDDCLQLHGGYGYMTEYPISRLWVDQRVQKIYAGTNEVMKEIISRSL